MPRLTMPVLAVPRLRLPRFEMPRFQMPPVRAPRIHIARPARLTWIVGLIVLLLLIAPVLYVFKPVASSASAARHQAAGHTAASGIAGLKPGSPQAIAATGVQTKTGLKYSTSCAGPAACLSMTGQTIGQGAAAILFSTAHTGGRECAGYVVQNGGSWQLGSVVCGLPGHVTPLVGRDAAVHVPGNCANAHSAASLQSSRLACLYDGTAVHVDGGPTFADGLIWWHTAKGWIAQDFLVSS